MRTLLFGAFIGIAFIPFTSHAIEYGRSMTPVPPVVATPTAPVRAVPAALQQRAASGGITCTKTVLATGCMVFSCSDGTKVNTCEIATTPKIQVIEGRTLPKGVLTAIAKPRVATTTVPLTYSEKKPATSWWNMFFKSKPKQEEAKPKKCEPTLVFESQCTLMYDCDKNLIRYSCAASGLGGTHSMTSGWCTYSTVGYNSQTGKAQCSVSCEKGPYSGGASGVNTCPEWMGVPDQKPNNGANAEYCKENPDDTFICNPSAG